MTNEQTDNHKFKQALIETFKENLLDDVTLSKVITSPQLNARSLNLLITLASNYGNERLLNEANKFIRHDQFSFANKSSPELYHRLCREYTFGVFKNQNLTINDFEATELISQFITKISNDLRYDVDKTKSHNLTEGDKVWLTILTTYDLNANLTLGELLALDSLIELLLSPTLNSFKRKVVITPSKRVLIDERKSILSNVPLKNLSKLLTAVNYKVRFTYAEVVTLMNLNLRGERRLAIINFIKGMTFKYNGFNLSTTELNSLLTLLKLNEI